MGHLVAHDHGQHVFIALDDPLQVSARDHDHRPHLAGLLVNLRPQLKGSGGIGVDLPLRLWLDKVEGRPGELTGVALDDGFGVEQPGHHFGKQRQVGFFLGQVSDFFFFDLKCLFFIRVAGAEPNWSQAQQRDYHGHQQEMVAHEGTPCDGSFWASMIAPGRRDCQ
jgi:hypothetical protein